MGTSQEQEMLIITPIFNHYNWFCKVACSQISSLYVTRSWRVKLHVDKSQSSSEALQSSLGKKPLSCCASLVLISHLVPIQHTAELTALLCSSLGWMVSIITWNWYEVPRKLWGNGSLNKWKPSIYRKKGWSWQGFTGPSHKESLGATHSLNASAVQRHSSLSSALQDVGMPSGTWLQC